MLVLNRRTFESIQIGDDIKITVTRIENNNVRIGIDAPKTMVIKRTELLEAQKREPVK